MFEDIKKEDERVIVGDSKAVSDPFDEIDPVAPLPPSAVATGRIRPVAQGSPPMPGVPGARSDIGPPQPLTNLAQVEDWSTKKSRRGIVISIILVVAVAGAGLAAAYAFQLLRNPQPGVNENLPSNENTPVSTNSENNENTNESPTNTNTNQPVDLPPENLIDSDGDGLTNLEEESLGTDPENIDTDSDSINDRDEQRVHKTNPLSPDTDNDALLDADELFVWASDPNNADTDGDTYLDGTEVQNGYSPTGPGKLPPPAGASVDFPPGLPQ